MNVDVINQCVKWLESDTEFYLVTITQTFGTSPRPKGSLFAYSPSLDLQSGSLSGGCIEADLIKTLRRHYSRKDYLSNSVFTCIYGKNAKESAQFFLPCGGQIHLFIEWINTNHIQHFYQIRDALNNNNPTQRIVSYSGKLIHYQVLDEVTQQEVIFFDTEQCRLSHLLSPIYELLIIGLGDVSICLSELAKRAEFSVSLCEPRVSQLERLKHQADKIRLFHELPDDLIRKSFSGHNVAIVCLAHDPKVDDLALMEVFSSSKAFYVGAMGSLRTTENRLKRLRDLGVTESNIKRLHAPIGFNIESKTPIEIAISIMAQLIHEREKNKKRNL